MLIFKNLPYAHDALEPVIDRETMEIHHGRHHKAYFDNFLAATGENSPKTSDELTALFAQMSNQTPAIRNNGGGFYNHQLFWEIMRAPREDNLPTGELAVAIERDFGSFDAFKAQFKDAGIKQFGSGWAWLVVQNGKLVISSTPNQDNPLMDVAVIRGVPILGCDVWEHAYYLKYQNKRADYLEAWFKVINWERVAELFGECTA